MELCITPTGRRDHRDRGRQFRLKKNIFSGINRLRANLGDGSQSLRR